MKLYLLRHGRTLWNEEGRLQGRTDVPLSDEGRCSALAAGAALESVPFDAAFSSPLQRARETAELILRGKEYRCADGCAAYGTGIRRGRGHAAVRSCGREAAHKVAVF